MTGKEEWVIWNGSLGVLVTAALGHVDEVAGGRRACLAPPWEIVGPFDLDELENAGRVAFGECLVMSRERWREDQAALRREGREKRRALQQRLARGPDDRAHRETLDLPKEGVLEASQINAAFRRQAKTAHPDAGGSDAAYRRISEARDALMEQAAQAIRA